MLRNRLLGAIELPAVMHAGYDRREVWTETALWEGKTCHR